MFSYLEIRFRQFTKYETIALHTGLRTLDWVNETLELVMETVIRLKNAAQHNLYHPKND